VFEERIMSLRAHTITNTELQRQVMKWSIDVPETARATVREGSPTLDGTVEWNFQRRAAARAVEHIAGVRNVVNNITPKHVPSSHDIHERIVSARHEGHR
jgi:hypothetical protein